MEQTARRIVTTLRSAGHEAYFAGGCVRDLLLGNAPADYDIATSARPQEVERLFRRTVAVGAQFGVIVVLEDDKEFEIATFRSDGNYLDGRRPESVTFSDAESDAQRRDFTINGLFYDPVEERVLDFVDGQRDLDARIVRAIGDPRQRFAEDKLRVLRGVRFSSRLDFAIEPATWEAIREGASQVSAVSAERIRDELVKILVHPQPPARLRSAGRKRPAARIAAGSRGTQRLRTAAGISSRGRRLRAYAHHARNASPSGIAASGSRRAVPRHRQASHLPTRRDRPHSLQWPRYVSAELTEKIMTRLRFSNAEISATDALVRNHMAFKDVQHMRVAKLKRFLARETIDDELELHRVDCGSSHGMLDNYEFLLAKREEFASEPLIPPPLVTGHDLIALGWKPGPRFKRALDAVETLQLEGALRSREAALAWLAAQSDVTM